MNASPRNSPRLSIAMIVRDEASSLATTLDSVRPIADEIVVVDTGSRDATLEIARRGADIVRQIEWRENFSAARNECLSHVTGDWILSLDAGETIDDSSAQQLRSFVDEAATDDKAYLLFVERPEARPGASCEQIGQIRLIPRRPELAFSGRVRETLFPSIRAAAMGVDSLDCVIRRPRKDLQPTRQRARALRNLNLVNLSTHDGTESLSTRLARAEAFSILHRWEDAASIYRAILAQAPRASSEMLEAYYGLLTALDASPSLFAPPDESVALATPSASQSTSNSLPTSSTGDEPLTVCLEALAIYPLDAQLLCAMGNYMLRAQRLDLATRAYELAALHGTVDPLIWHLSDLPDVATVCLSLALQLGADQQRAEQVIVTALDDRPESVRLRRQLIDICIKQQREREALQHCRLLPTTAPVHVDLSEVVRGAILVVAKRTGEAIAKLRRAFDQGCRDLLTLRWLSAAYLAEGRLAEARAIVAEWALHEPGNLEVVAFRRALDEQSPSPRAGDRSRDQGLRRIDKGSPAPVPINWTPAAEHTRAPRT